MRVALISANFNSFDKPFDWAKQNADIFPITDMLMPVRQNAMTPRLQSKLVKEFGWQLYPGYDVYIWVDSSFKLLEGAVDWLVSYLKDADMVFFKHPWNKSIKAEYQFIKDNFHKKYLSSRYTNEFLEEQYKVIAEDKDYVDDLLLCGGIIVYRNNSIAKSVLKEWWYYTSRYHMDDQLSLPYVVKKSGCKYNIIKDDIYHLPLMPHMRKT